MSPIRKLAAALSFLPALVAPASVIATGVQQGSAHDFTFEAIEGGQMPLAGFKGRVMLIVNTASFCGFTDQYKGLQALHERFEPRGLVVVGVPSNDFGEQEPGTAAEIKSFCEGAFGVTFPLTGKVAVKGDAAHPFYRWARGALGEAAAPRWNFHKYLVGRDGRLIAGFATSVRPDDARLVEAIETALEKAKPGL